MCSFASELPKVRQHREPPYTNWLYHPIRLHSTPSLQCSASHHRFAVKPTPHLHHLRRNRIGQMSDHTSNRALMFASFRPQDPAFRE